jgi:hypothetical protein
MNQKITSRKALSIILWRDNGKTIMQQEQSV